MRSSSAHGGFSRSVFSHFMLRYQRGCLISVRFSFVFTLRVLAVDCSLLETTMFWMRPDRPVTDDLSVLCNDYLFYLVFQHRSSVLYCSFSAFDSPAFQPLCTFTLSWLVYSMVLSLESTFCSLPNVSVCRYFGQQYHHCCSIITHWFQL